MTSPCNSPTWLRNAAPIDPMTIDQCRRFYADEIRYAANLHSPALIEAFARVPREHFLGPGPWQIGAPDEATGKVEYQTTASADPRHVYHNVTIALDPARNLCNGQPSSLAAWISALDLQPGNRVFHLGCGVGYFTAIMSEVVGITGRVIASEVDAALAARAQQNLVEYSNVEVHAADGAALDPGMCDAIFINAGVTHPHPLWLERLREGGRMILPLTIPMSPQIGKGVMAKIVRKSAGFSAKVVSFVAIYSCTSARDPQLEPLLTKAMTTGALFKMKSVRCDAHEPAGSCIVHGQGACISAAEPQGEGDI
jgi:protein-L-isoaspartate(D-aspartate) O-methyltransferase